MATPDEIAYLIAQQQADPRSVWLVEQVDGSWTARSPGREYRLTHDECRTLIANAPDGQAIHHELRDPRWDWRHHRHPLMR